MSGKHIQSSGLESGPSLKKYIELIDQVRMHAQEAKAFLGWVRLPFSQEHLKASMKWSSSIPKSQETLVVLGIGGSCLGARAVYDFLQPEGSVIFIDNVDGHAFQRHIDSLSLRKTHFLVISKSGETFETLFQLAHVMQELKAKRLKFQNHISVVSEDNQGKLRKLSKEFGLRFLSMPADVGGRFSVFSAVGLAPLAWAGVDCKRLLEGAVSVSKDESLIAGLTRYYSESFDRLHWISIFWCYADGLKTFGLWLEQLWAESLAKKLTRSGQKASRASTPLSCVGATDQHSLLQQFTEGARDKSFTFIRCQSSEKSKKLSLNFSESTKMAKGRSLGELLAIEAAATEKILNDLDIPTARLILKDHTPQAIGALLYLYEMVVASLGECLDINAFDQPGVEGVKQIIRSSLK